MASRRQQWHAGDVGGWLDDGIDNNPNVLGSVGDDDGSGGFICLNNALLSDNEASMRDGSGGCFQFPWFNDNHRNGRGGVATHEGILKVPSNNPSSKSTPKNGKSMKSFFSPATSSVPEFEGVPTIEGDDDVMQVVGKELGKLSLEQQSKITYDVHGVVDAPTSNNKVAHTTNKNTAVVGAANTSHNMSDMPDNDIHDDNDENEESSQFIHDRLQELYRNLIHGIRNKNEIDIEKAKSYLHAVSMAPDLYGISSTTNTMNPEATETVYYKASTVQSYNFYMTFLESTEYDPIEAAKKIVLNFHFKNKLFGLEKVDKTITLDDLSPRDIEAMESGMLMWLPSTDMAGRHVAQITFNLAALDNWENHERANYYTMMTGMMINHSKRSRKLGCILVVDCIDAVVSRQILAKTTEYAPMYTSFPGIIRSLHYMWKSSHFLRQIAGPMKWILYNGTARDVRLRVRMHFGGHIENHYTLMSYGIPEKLLLSDLRGKLRVEYVNIWIDKQREREKKHQQQKRGQLQLVQQTTPHGQPQQQHKQQPQSQETHNPKSSEKTDDDNVVDDNNEKQEIIPTDNDVLFGRGVPVQTHAGNVKLIKLIDESYDDYTQLAKFNKTMMAWNVVAKVQADGGRFLEREYDTTKKKEIGSWKVACDQKDHRKVAFGFRDQKKRIQKSSSEQQSKRQRRGCF